MHHYYKREIEYLKERHFNEEEIEFNLRLVLGMMKDSIRKSYEKSLKTFQELEQADKYLPKEERYDYPKPDINTIEIFQLGFEHLPTLSFPNGRRYFMKDFEMVENVLDKVFAKGTKSVSETSKTETGIFCNLIHELGIDLRKADESVEAYCKRICSKYNLEYSDKVRQKFSERNTKKNSEAITVKILPFIDELTKEKIQEHLIKKNLLNRNLYG